MPQARRSSPAGVRDGRDGPRRGATAANGAEDRDVFEIDGLDRLAAEALGLELVRLARRFGFERAELRIGPGGGGRSRGSA